MVLVPLENRDQFHHGIPEPSPAILSIPSFPSIPSYPVVPTIPSFPTVPVIPSYQPAVYNGVVDTGYGIAQPGILSYLPVNPYSWNFNIVDRFNGKLLIILFAFNRIEI